MIRTAEDLLAAYDHLPKSERQRFHRLRAAPAPHREARRKRIEARNRLLDRFITERTLPTDRPS